MDLQPILDFLVGIHPSVPIILSLLGSLVVLGQVYVAMTPNPKDNEILASFENNPFLGPLLKALRAFSPIQKK